MTKYSCGDTVYGMGVVGALFYYLQHAGDLTQVLVGIVKSILWPAFLVFRLLGFLGM